MKKTFNNKELENQDQLEKNLRLIDKYMLSKTTDGQNEEIEKRLKEEPEFKALYDTVYNSNISLD